MWVAVYHAQGWPQLPQMNQFFRAVFSWGFIGVDIFFVISGCVMALVINKNSTGGREAVQFTTTRLARIYIGWWPLFLLYCGWLFSIDQLGPDKDIFNSFSLLLAPPQNLVTAVLWTLTFELYFYMLMGTLILLDKQYRVPFLKFAFFGVAAYTAYMALQSRFEPENVLISTSAMRFWVSPLLLEFLGGFLVYCYVVDNPMQNRKLWLFTAGLLLACGAAYHQYLARHPGGLEVFYHYPERALLLGGGCCALMGWLLSLPERMNSKWVTIVSLLGGASYAIYLLHPLMLSVSSAVFNKINPANSHRTMMFVFMAVVLIGVSVLYHHFIERPLYLRVRDLINRMTGKPERNRHEGQPAATP